jgi:enediyne biosynthesis protein E4
MKAPHVEIQDFDNDGWDDIVTSVVKFAQGKPCPVIFKGLGVRDGLPRFRDDAMGVNDYPTDEDRSMRNTGEFFKKVIKDRKIVYTAPGPSGDFDNDGRLDLFLANWWLESPSMLLRNETPGGHWLNVRLQGAKDVNRMGLGSRIRIYKAGQGGQAAALIGCREMSVGFGYVSGQPAIAHFGLGKEEACDVEVDWPFGKGKVLKSSVKADQLVTIER